MFGGGDAIIHVLDYGKGKGKEKIEGGGRTDGLQQRGRAFIWAFISKGKRGFSLSFLG